MFSSITKSIKSIAGGPRAILAEKIAEVLSEHFVLDPKDIESNLLSDTRIVLKNTELRKKEYVRAELPSTVISVEGVVREVTFSWSWSFGGGGSSNSATRNKPTSSASSSSPSSRDHGYASSGGMVQDTVLVIKGLEVRVGLRRACEDLETDLVYTTIDENSTAEGNTKSASDSEPQGFMQQYIQQIVDHLTLKIEDFRFVIQDGDHHGASVIIAGKGIELGTLASNKSPRNEKGSPSIKKILSQKLSIDSFSVDVTTSTKNGSPSPTYPLLEPFGYVTSVTRLSGTRFQGGILSGLEIVGFPELARCNTAEAKEGEPDGNIDGGILLHVGREQMQALCAIGVMLAPSPDTVTPEETSVVMKNEDEAKEINLSADKDNVSTTFNLPFPALTIVLPPLESTGEQTKITLPKATVVYRTDGKLFHIKGQDGIKESGKTLIKLDEGGEWAIDFVQKSFRLGGSMEVDKKWSTLIDIHQTLVEKILSSIAPLLLNDDIVSLQHVWEERKSTRGFQAQDATSDSWSCSVDPVVLRLEGVNNNVDAPTWIEVNLSSSYVVLSRGVNGDGRWTPSEIKIENILLKSSLDDASFIAIPSISLKEGALLVPGTVEASIQSTNEVQKMKDVISAFRDKFKIISNHDDAMDLGDEVKTLPFMAMKIQNVSFSVKSRDLTIKFKNISSEQNSFSCENIMCTEGLMKMQCQNSCISLQTSSTVAAETTYSRSEDGYQMPEKSTAMFIDVTLDACDLWLYKDLDQRVQTRSLRTKFIDMAVNVIHPQVKLELKSQLDFRVEGVNEEWIEGFLGSTKTSIDVTDPSRLLFIESSGANISASSFGRFVIDIPSVTMLPDESVVTIGSTGTDSLNTYVESTAMVKQIQNFLRDFLGQNTSGNTSEELKAFQTPFRIPRLKLSVTNPHVRLIVESIAVDTDSIEIDSLKYSGSDDVHCLVSNVSATLGTTVEVSCSIEEGGIPQIAQFDGPIQNVRFSLEENFGAAKVELGTVKILMLRSVISSVSSTHGVEGSDIVSGNFSFLEVPVNINIARFRIHSVPEEDIKAHVAGIELTLSSTDNLLHVETLDKMNVQITHANEWVRCAIQPSFVAVPDTLAAPAAMTCGGFSMLSSSLGQISVTLPPFTLLPDWTWISVDTPLRVSLKSLDVAQKLQNLLSSAFKYDPKTGGQPATRPTPMPPIKLEQIIFGIQDTSTNTIINSISIENSVMKCASLGYQDTSGKVLSVQGIEIHFVANPCAKIDTVSSLFVPGVMKLKQPMRNISMTYVDGSIRVRTKTVNGSLESKNPEHLKSPSTDFSSDSLIPLPILIDVDVINLDAGRNFMVLFETVSLSMNQSGSLISFATRQNMKVQLKRSENEWINAELGRMSIILYHHLGNIKPQKAEFSGGTIGPCAPTIGRLSVDIPPIHKKADEKRVIFGNDIAMEVGSLEILDKVRPLFDAFTEFFCTEQHSESSTFNQVPFPIQIPGITLSVTTPASKIRIANISASDFIINIFRIQLSVEGSCTSSLRDIAIDLASNNMIVGFTESLIVPGSIALSKPVINVSLRYKDGTLSVNLPSPVYTEMLNQELGQSQVPSVPQVISPNQPSHIGIPFPVEIGLAQICVKQLSDGDDKSLHFQNLVLDLIPVDVPGQDLINAPLGDLQKKGLRVSLRIADIEHQLFQARNIKASLLLPLDDATTVHELDVALDFAKVTAGFSSVDWSSLLLLTDETSVPQKTLKTPFAKVGSFDLSFSYDGKIVASHANILVPPFSGDPFTTNKDLQSHYSNIVLQRVPGFLTNAEFLGGNIVDSSFSNVGRIAVGSKSLTGAGIGSVAGLVVSDGIKSAIVAGKKARNANVDDGYKFGDITRGIVRGTSKATMKGARTRGSDGSDYLPGDLTVGAVMATGEYVGDNKQKLASAGGAGVASVVGMAVAGPIGFIAGSYLGSKLGKNIVEDDESNEIDGHRTMQSAGLIKQSSQYEQHSVHNQVQPTLLQQNQPANTSIPRSTQSTARYISSHHQSSTQHSGVVYAHQQQSFQPNLLQNHANQHQTNHSYHTQSGYTPPSSAKSPQIYNSSHLPTQDIRLSGNHHHVVDARQQSFHMNSSQIQTSHLQTKESKEPHPRHPNDYQAHQTRNHPPAHQRQTREGYKFGDFTKNIVNKGKETDGRQTKDGYKFGDFTRGLFK